jgi:hypothetical protein
MERAIVVEVKMVISVYIILIQPTLNLILTASEGVAGNIINNSSIRIDVLLHFKQCVAFHVGIDDVI